MTQTSEWSLDWLALAGWMAWACALGWWGVDRSRPTVGLAAVLVLGGARLRDAWRGASGTALRPAVAWMFLSWLLTLAAQLAAMAEPVAGGRPATGHLTYLASLGALAAAVSLLNARRPGEGAWALLTMLLVLVFLIPWLEGSGLAGRVPAAHRLRLEAPWSVFYSLIALMAVLNHLPTRFGPAALAVGIGWACVLRGLRGGPPVRVAEMWGGWGWFAAASLRSPPIRRSELPGGSELERLWRWFRDRWGVVWALRVQERFQQSAQRLGWSVRLRWQGIETALGDPVPPAAASTLAALLSRFARSERLAAVRSPCGPGPD